LQAQYAQKVQGIRMLRLRLKHLRIKSLGFSKPPRLMMLKGAAKQRIELPGLGHLSSLVCVAAKPKEHVKSLAESFERAFARDS